MLLIHCAGSLSARCYRYQTNIKASCEVTANGHQLFHLLYFIFLGPVSTSHMLWWVFGSPKPKMWDVSSQNYT